MNKFFIDLQKQAVFAHSTGVLEGSHLMELSVEQAVEFKDNITAGNHVVFENNGFSIVQSPGDMYEYSAHRRQFEASKEKIETLRLAAIEKIKEKKAQKNGGAFCFRLSDYEHRVADWFPVEDKFEYPKAKDGFAINKTNQNQIHKNRGGEASGLSLWIKKTPALDSIATAINTVNAHEAFVDEVAKKNGLTVGFALSISGVQYEADRIFVGANECFLDRFNRSFILFLQNEFFHFFASNERYYQKLLRFASTCETLENFELLDQKINCVKKYNGSGSGWMPTIEIDSGVINGAYNDTGLALTTELPEDRIKLEIGLKPIQENKTPSLVKMGAA